MISFEYLPRSSLLWLDFPVSEFTHSSGRIVSVVVLGIDDGAFVDAPPRVFLATVVWTVVWDRSRVVGISSHLENCFLYSWFKGFRYLFGRWLRCKVMGLAMQI
jgi:hypothetical protein